MLDDIDLKINKWIVNTVNSLIKPNKLDKIAECALELSKIIYYNDMNVKKYLEEISLMQKELNIKREISNINFSRPTQIIELINGRKSYWKYLSNIFLNRKKILK